MYSTLRIEMLDASMSLKATATGFLFAFLLNKETGNYVPALVTNRHVLGECENIRVEFTRGKHDGSPDTGVVDCIEIDTSASIFHPNPQIDLAILPMADAIRTLQRNNVPPSFTVLERSIIPSCDAWASFDAVETVTMVGYPRGLYDKYNNLPIFRRGITATHPSYDFQGKPTFLVDMACYPGSSGSPVFLLSEGSFSNPREHSVQFGTRLFLLGIQHAAPVSKEVGVLVEVFEAPSSQSVIKPMFDSFYNLGVIIKSTELLAFDPILKSMHQ